MKVADPTMKKEEIISFLKQMIKEVENADIAGFAPSLDVRTNRLESYKDVPAMETTTKRYDLTIHIENRKLCPTK